MNVLKTVVTDLHYLTALLLDALLLDLNWVLVLLLDGIWTSKYFSTLEEYMGANFELYDRDGNTPPLGNW